MKISETNVRKLIITDAPMPEGRGVLDPISVYIEDFGPGAGKITITCFGEAWSHYWSHMGEQHTLATFFSKCDQHYLAGKLKNGIDHIIRDDDPASVEQALKRKIIERRLEDSFDKETARGLWNEVEYMAEGIAGNAIGDSESELLFHLFGDEWWHCLPKKTNPAYEYLCQIIKTVQAALRQLPVDNSLKSTVSSQS